MMKHDFLIEIGTEELPPKILRTLGRTFAASIENALQTQHIGCEKVQWFASPRRLAVLIEQADAQAPEQQLAVWGPPEKIAFDADGKPGRAAAAFAKKNQLALDDLLLEDSPKGRRLVHRRRIDGALTTAVIPDIVSTALEQLPVPRRMRWSDLRELFVRPVHWVLLLVDDKVLPCTVLGVQSGGASCGHRFHHPGRLPVESARQYRDTLREKGRVVVDFAERKSLIRQQVEERAAALNASALIDPDLLDEVTALVEWPVALTGSFEARFLKVPPEALISSMQAHQKYFPLVDGNGKLLPHFIFVANIASTDPASVVAGNEKVIRPRLADAEFFFETDKKHSLASRVERLDSIVFQARLGSVRDKTDRVASLAGFVARAIGGDSVHTRRAAQLAKADLTSEMVLEFSDLQGIAGSYYALNDGEDSEVATAIREQYLPRFSGDALPTTKPGCALALADRMDSLVGVFGIGQAPTGSRDPFALRRATLGIIRIIRDKRLYQLDINDLLFEAIAAYGDSLSNPSVAQEVSDFFFDRYRALYQDEGIAAQSIIAVQQVLQKNTGIGHNPYDVSRRIHAVETFRQRPEAQALAAANKRVQNILAKQDPGREQLPVKPELFDSSFETDLYRQVLDMAQSVPALCDEKKYGDALTQLATLKQPIDAFFDHVMVMDEDIDKRNNRINLLGALHQLFIRIADISQLQSQG